MLNLTMRNPVRYPVNWRNCRFYGVVSRRRSDVEDEARRRGFRESYEHSAWSFDGRFGLAWFVPKY